MQFVPIKQYILCDTFLHLPHPSSVCCRDTPPALLAHLRSLVKAHLPSSFAPHPYRAASCLLQGPLLVAHGTIDHKDQVFHQQCCAKVVEFNLRWHLVFESRDDCFAVVLCARSSNLHELLREQLPKRSRILPNRRVEQPLFQSSKFLEMFHFVPFSQNLSSQRAEQKAVKIPSDRVQSIIAAISEKTRQETPAI